VIFLILSFHFVNKNLVSFKFCIVIILLTLCAHTHLLCVRSHFNFSAALNLFISQSTDKCLLFFKILRKAFGWSKECEEAFNKLKEYLSNPSLLIRPTKGEILCLLFSCISLGGKHGTGK
jgi:uncharacterized membrane protein YbhN (UPF0104 family)